MLKKRDSVLQELDSPKNPTSLRFLAPPRSELTRALTPDSMHERLPGVLAKEVAEPGVRDLHLSNMHNAVGVAAGRTV
jgi:hypothetical protein